MEINNTALIVVDIQERLHPVILEADKMTKECVTLLKGIKLLGVPVIATEQYSKGLGKTVEPIREFLDEETTFEKREYSFAIPEVMEYLEKNNIENVIVLGEETHICVFQGTRALLSAGYNVYLPLSCVGSRTSENKANGFEQMRALGAVISNVETILFDLMKTSTHPHFKEVQNLIK